jgi:uncharacterized protein YutE (UPF0331/DUF86 family)
MMEQTMYLTEVTYNQDLVGETTTERLSDAVHFANVIAFRGYDVSIHEAVRGIDNGVEKLHQVLHWVQE